MGSVVIIVSAALSLLSCPFPRSPPGSRSMEEPAGGAAPGLPSTKLEAAEPHETESMTAPPVTRRTTEPPVALRPLL
jgi:hypothetical protein